MLVNYVRDCTRDSRFNHSVVRMLVALYAIWKLLSYEWAVLQSWPSFVLLDGPQGFLVPSTLVVELVVELWLVCGVLLAVAAGYRLGASCFVSAVLIAHLSGVHYNVTNQASTFLPIVYLLLVFALFRDDDVVSLDAAREAASRPLDELEEASRPDSGRRVELPALRWALLVLALVYFFTGFGKVQSGDLSWATAENLSKTIHMEAMMHLGPVPLAGRVIIENQLFAGLAAALTLILELGFLPAIMLGGPVWPFAVGLLGMHSLIAMSMNILFFDQYVLFALFLPWETLFKRIESTDALTIVYDDSCRCCVGLCYILDRLDVNGVVNFVSNTHTDRCPDRPDVSNRDLMYAYDDTGVYHRSDALRRLVTHYLGFDAIGQSVKLPFIG